MTAVTKLTTEVASLIASSMLMSSHLLPAPPCEAPTSQPVEGGPSTPKSGRTGTGNKGAKRPPGPGRPRGLTGRAPGRLRSVALYGEKPSTCKAKRSFCRPERSEGPFSWDAAQRNPGLWERVVPTGGRWSPPHSSKLSPLACNPARPFVHQPHPGGVFRVSDPGSTLRIYRTYIRIRVCCGRYCRSPCDRCGRLVVLGVGLPCAGRCGVPVAGAGLL
jgi:hypothetical protein